MACIFFVHHKNLDSSHFTENFDNNVPVLLHAQPSVLMYIRQRVKHFQNWHLTPRIPHDTFLRLASLCSTGLLPCQQLLAFSRMIVKVSQILLLIFSEPEFFEALHPIFESLDFIQLCRNDSQWNKIFVKKQEIQINVWCKAWKILVS